MRLGREEIELSYQLSSIEEIDELLDLKEKRKKDIDLRFSAVVYLLVALTLMVSWMITITSTTGYQECLTPDQILEWTTVYLFLQAIVLIVFEIYWRLKPKKEQEQKS